MRVMHHRDRAVDGVARAGEPEPAPRGTTGTPCRVATSMTAATSAVLRGRTTAAGVPAGASIAWSRA